MNCQTLKPKAMKNPEKKANDLIIRSNLKAYMAETCPIRKDIIYNRRLHKFFNQVISGVFKNFGILGYENIDISVEELRQEAILKIFLKLITQKDIDTIKSITDFSFIVARNCVVDLIRKSDTYKKYHSLWEDECGNGEYNIFRDYLYSC